MAKKKASAKKAKTVGKVTNGTLFEHYEKLKNTVTEMEDDVRKLGDEQVKAAGRRIRVMCMELKKTSAQMRKDVMAFIKSLK